DAVQDIAAGQQAETGEARMRKHLAGEFPATGVCEGIQVVEIAITGANGLEGRSAVGHGSNQTVARPVVESRPNQTIEPSGRQNRVVIEKYNEPAANFCQRLIDRGGMASIGFVANNLEADRFRSLA